MKALLDMFVVDETNSNPKGVDKVINVSLEESLKRPSWWGQLII